MNEEHSGMEVDLGRVEDRATLSFDKTFDIPTPEGDSADVTAHVTVDVVRSGGRYELSALVTGMVRAHCHRCLASFDLPVTTAFDLVVNRGERTAEPPEGIEEEDFITIPMTGEGRYDIFPRVREALILEIPIKLLCREDCKGVCRGCGANLNVVDCGCEAEAGDPRWDTLKKFLNDEDKT
jgi:uncharacterized protein